MGAVERGHLSEEDPPRPSVVDQMVLDMNEHVVIVSEAHQSPPNEGYRVNGDALVKELTGHCVQCASWITGVTKVGDGKGDPGRGLDHLLPGGATSNESGA